MKDQDLINKYQKKIDNEKRVHGPYKKRAQKIYNRWSEEKTRMLDEERAGSRFNILYSNTEVVHSAIYSGDSKPDVRRRFKDSDKDARELAELMERALEYSNDEDNLSKKLDSCIDDYLVSGLGIPRIRYVPYFKDGIRPKIPVAKFEMEPDEYGETPGGYRYQATPEESEPYDVMEDQVEYNEMDEPYTYGEPEQEKVWEKVETEVHPWNQFGWQPANSWENVNWIYFEHFLDEDEIESQYGKAKASGVPLGYDQSGEHDEDDQKNTHARVFEFYDKIKRKLCIFAEGDDKFLEYEDDPLGLEGFYPCPEPLMSNTRSTKLEPIPAYIYYQDQARELDKITYRIDRLTEALKLRGVYDASFPALQDLASSGDNVMIGIDDFERLEGKGFDSVFMFMPVEEIARVIVALVQQRNEIKQTIYEITGISDIVRGATKASETLGAQQMKQANAGARVGLKDRPVELLIRSVYRLKVEVMLEHFDRDTLTLMTGVDITDEMYQIMKSDMLRCYKIQVETDATVAQEAAEDKKNRIEVIGAITQFLTGVAPLVQAQLIPIAVAKEILLFAIRGFKKGRQLENILEGLGDQNEQSQQPGGNPGQQPEGSEPGGIQPGQGFSEMGITQIGAQLPQG